MVLHSCFMADSTPLVNYQRLFHALPDNYLLLAPDGTILDNSDAHQAVSLRARAEVVGRHIFAAYPVPDPQQQAELATSQDHVRTHRQPHTVALRYDLGQPAAQGGGFVARYWEVTHFPILDNTGQLLFILQRPQDVTAPRAAAQRAETLRQELAEVQSFSQFVLEGLPVLVAATAPDGQANYFNPRWEEFTGRPVAELVGGGWADLVHPDDRAKMLRERDGSLDRAAEVQYDFRLRRRDGHYRWMLGRTVPRFDAEGKLVRRIGFVVDVHEQKELVRELLDAGEQQALAVDEAYRAHQRVQQQRAALHGLFMEAPALVAITRGPEHVYEFVNPPYQELFPDRELLGRSVAEAVPEAVAQGFVTLLDGVYQTGEPWVGKEVLFVLHRADHSSQEVYVDFLYQALREDGQVVGLTCFATDVTELVRLREALAARPAGTVPGA